MPCHDFVVAALRRHLLSFQCNSPRSFPQVSQFSIHLGTSPSILLPCRSPRKLSQPATPCAILAHFEICKDSPFSISIKELSDAKTLRRPPDSLLSGRDLC